MSEILARALVREFPGEDLNRLLVDNPLARVATVKSAKYVVIPKKEGDAAYYAYRQGSLHRLISNHLP